MKARFVCSCGILFGENKATFDVSCRTKGHTLFEIEEGVYCLIYLLQETNQTLRCTLNKRNRNIAVLKANINNLMTELNMHKAI
jgi:hypothetical protein